jgi:hypothetical protein
MNWSDLIDAIGLVAGTKNRLLDHFMEERLEGISLRALMDMCLESAADKWGFSSPPLLKVYGIGRKGFWSVVNGLTSLDLGNQCNDEWRTKLVKVKQRWGITGATPYSSPDR